MEKIWQAAILDTRFYSELQEALGCTVHHSLLGPEDGEAHKIALATMQALYGVYFSPIPCPDVINLPPRPSQIVRLSIRDPRQHLPLSGIFVDLALPVQALKDALSMRSAHHDASTKLSLQGQELEDGARSLREDGVVNNSIIARTVDNLPDPFVFFKVHVGASRISIRASRTTMVSQ
jgi:hypothetical protein